MLPPEAQFKSRTGRLLRREVRGSCVSALVVTFPAGPLLHPQVLALPDRKTGAQELH